MMHLPPLEVAVYPVVTMSHGRPPAAAVPAPNPVSLDSSNSCAALPDFSSIQKVIRNVFRSSKITVQQAERLQGRLHQVFLTRLADSSCLVLKCPPTSNTRHLRHEKHSLETERKALETLHEYTTLPVAQVIKYDSQGGSFRSPYLMMSYVPGRRLSELSAYLSLTEKRTVDRTLGAYVRQLTGLSATQFGSTHEVFAKKGYKTWRDAFFSFLESILRDGEDMLVTIPYNEIRLCIARHAQYLDEVTQPCLVALNVCEPQNVLIDERTKQISGLVGFSNVLWGDPLMSGAIDLEHGSEAFFQGFGGRPSCTRGVIVRGLMYKIYRSTMQVVGHYYRPHLEANEMGARRSLTTALDELDRM